jgi:hypothetical protein
MSSLPAPGAPAYQHEASTAHAGAPAPVCIPTARAFFEELQREQGKRRHDRPPRRKRGSAKRRVVQSPLRDVTNRPEQGRLALERNPEDGDSSGSEDFDTPVACDTEHDVEPHNHEAAAAVPPEKEPPQHQQTLEPALAHDGLESRPEQYGRDSPVPEAVNTMARYLECKVGIATHARRYAEALIADGFDTPDLFMSLTDDELTSDYGFKKGHVRQAATHRSQTTGQGSKPAAAQAARPVPQQLLAYRVASERKGSCAADGSRATGENTERRIIEQEQLLIHNLSRVVASINTYMSQSKRAGETLGDDRTDLGISKLIRIHLCEALVPLLTYGFKSFKLFGEHHFWDFLEQLLDDQLEKSNDGSFSVEKQSAKYNLCRAVAIIADIKLMEKKNDMRVRAFICYGMNVQSLHRWIRELHVNTRLAEKFFEPWSYIRAERSRDTLIQALRPLCARSFRLAIDYEVASVSKISVPKVHGR